MSEQLEHDDHPQRAPDTGMLVSEVQSMRVPGNTAEIGQPTSANPIADASPANGPGFTGFENLVGAATQDDWFDLRDGAIADRHDRRPRRQRFARLPRLHDRRPT